MDCIFCQSNTQVIDSRKSEDTFRRRRECLKCNKRFTTYERPELEMYVAKKDGRREKYDRNKLIIGLMKACEKRPITRERVEKTATQIENKFRGEAEITSKQLGNMIMRKLKTLDKVAYIRFASVYQEFDDIKKFREALKGLN